MKISASVGKQVRHAASHEVINAQLSELEDAVMAKSVKYMLSQPFYVGDEDGTVLQPGQLYDSESAVPEGAAYTAVIHDSEAPEPQFHPVNIPESAYAEQVAAQAPPPEPKTKTEPAAAKAEPAAAKHESAGGKAGGRA
jgi:hypothetical protein